MSPRPIAEPTGSRDRVLELLRRAPAPLGVAELVEASGLSANTVRFHLSRLLASGSLRTTKDPAHQGPGRPALVYTAAPAEAVDTAAAYRVLAGLLATELSRSGRPQASTDAGRAWARTIRQGRGVDPGADPVDVVLDLFTDTGFEPVLATDGRTVELHRCPFLDLATEQPDVVCGVHLGLLREVLDVFSTTTQVRLTPVLDGAGPCLVRLGPDPSASLPLNAPRSPAPSIKEHVS